MTSSPELGATLRSSEMVIRFFLRDRLPRVTCDCTDGGREPAGACECTDGGREPAGAPEPLYRCRALPAAVEVPD